MPHTHTRSQYGGSGAGKDNVCNTPVQNRETLGYKGVSHPQQFWNPSGQIFGRSPDEDAVFLLTSGESPWLLVQPSELSVPSFESSFLFLERWPVFLQLRVFLSLLIPCRGFEFKDLFSFCVVFVPSIPSLQCFCQYASITHKIFVGLLWILKFSLLAKLITIKDQNQRYH